MSLCLSGLKQKMEGKKNHTDVPTLPTKVTLQKKEKEKEEEH